MKSRNIVSKSSNLIKILKESFTENLNQMATNLDTILNFEY